MNKVMISTCSIEFLVILNYPAITNIFAVNNIISSYCMIVWVRVVLKRTVVGD